MLTQPYIHNGSFVFSVFVLHQRPLPRTLKGSSTSLYISGHHMDQALGLFRLVNISYTLFSMQILPQKSNSIHMVDNMVQQEAQQGVQRSRVSYRSQIYFRDLVKSQTHPSFLYIHLSIHPHTIIPSLHF